MTSCASAVTRCRVEMTYRGRAARDAGSKSGVVCALANGRFAGPDGDAADGPGTTTLIVL